VTIELNFPGNYLLLGDNGSGKSTIMKLMMGLYVPEEGRCLINNSLIHGMNGDCWYLSQNVALYQDSIINNIKLGDETITNDMINQSLKCVELFDDVVKLPDKLHTVIREEGRNLSQGQRSRLALARILVRRPEILLLDEFDANIDQNTANNIICNIREEFPRTSIVAISHIARTGIYSGFNRIAVKNQKMFHLN
jgi:ABC-type bacteriocin/lantibiotic exporter with double-glycine peptidase domain